ncbi:steroid delta-isomerase [Nocardia panacis]|uniref:Steroid delta-isomerase n=1 Tax=Nocardia panacis TaxID=2340916 RepID=A0A3A4K9I9_9NOCA|nr:nuclear transport factor 2 family protein [Nocardia panacis]RJO69833.1 steroid delta-isomerase [Nocardia panacis]
MAQQIRATIERYVTAVGSGDTDDILALYAPEATVEDPVGTPIRTTREQLREFYDVLTGLERHAELHEDAVRIADRHAAFRFTLVTTVAGQRFTVSPIDVMEFDADGRILTMRAFWGSEDLRAEPI